MRGILTLPVQGTIISDPLHPEHRRVANNAGCNSIVYADRRGSLLIRLRHPFGLVPTRGRTTTPAELPPLGCSWRSRRGTNTEVAVGRLTRQHPQRRTVRVRKIVSGRSSLRAHTTRAASAIPGRRIQMTSGTSNSACVLSIVGNVQPFDQREGGHFTVITGLSLSKLDPG